MKTTLPFAAAHWQTAIKEAIDQVQEAYPAGYLDWLRQSDPERIDKLKDTVKAAKRAYLAQDVKALDAALASYLSLHLETFAEFRREQQC